MWNCNLLEVFLSLDWVVQSLIIFSIVWFVSVLKDMIETLYNQTLNFILLWKKKPTKKE